MCITPIYLPNGQEVACRNCWQCTENRINDWVGRCIAEREVSAASNSVTLTYGRDEDGESDHLRAAVLTYSDVQKYLKLLRKNGYPCRYFAVGELGSKKGRAHWHVLLFWKDRAPPHELRKNIAAPYWEHGYSFWDAVDGPSIRYVCKYIQKDVAAQARQGHLAMSKKPPLGAEFFRRRACRFVAAGLSPQDAFYTFPGVDTRQGKPVRYMLTGRSLDLFCEAYVLEWNRVNPGRWWPTSDLIEAYLDRMAKDEKPFQLERRYNRRVSRPFIDPPVGSGPVEFSDSHNCYYVLHGGRRLWWSHDLEGKRAWQREIRTETGNPLVRRLAQLYRERSGATVSTQRLGPGRSIL